MAATQEGKTILTVLDEPLEFSLREPSKQVRHVPTAKEIADAKKYPKRVYIVLPRGLSALRSSQRILRQMWRGLDILKGQS